MTNRTSPMRRYSRYPVRWPVLYRSDELLAAGTVLDVTHIGWRVAGPMPVTPGMHLTLELSVPERSEPIRVHRATVLWVKDCEFAIEAHEMDTPSQEWVNEFLKQKLGLPWLSEPETDTDDIQPFDKNAHHNAGGTGYRPVPKEDFTPIVRLGGHLMKDVEQEVIRRSMDKQGCREEEARAAYTRFIEEVWHPALSIARGMKTHAFNRDILGKDSISWN